MKNRQRKVWLGQCFETIIVSVITFLTILLPYSINNGVSHTLDFLPVFGNGEIINTQFGVINNFFGLFGLSSDTFYFIFKNNLVFFYSILLSNVFFSLLLIVTQSNVVRKIVKILSILFGIIMIIISLSFLAIIVSIVYSLFTGFFSTDVLLSLKTCGIIYYFVTIFFSISLIKKQFGWFSERTW